MRIPVLILLAMVAAAAGSLVVASLALTHVVGGWGIFLFYAVPALFFLGWAARELAPDSWRRVETPFRWAWRRSRFAGPAPAPAREWEETSADEERAVPPPEPKPKREDSPPVRGGSLVGALREILRGALRPWLALMRIFLRVWRSRRGRRVLNAGFGLAALGIFALVAREFSSIGWPLDHADVGLGTAAGAFFLSTFAFKALGWQRLFRPTERPRSLTLAAATGAAAVTGLALPGRFDDAVRIAVVRRLPGRRPGVGTLALSLFLLGMIDAGALAPLAVTAAIGSATSIGVRIGLGIVAFAGVGAAAVVAALPRIGESERLGRYRLTHWLAKHAPASPRDAWWSWVFVMASWISRATAIFLLLGALGLGLSFTLAITYLAAGAASGALPISPAGAATQAGVGAAVLAAGGVGTNEAVAFAVAAQVLTVLAGGVVVLFAALLRGGGRLARS